MNRATASPSGNGSTGYRCSDSTCSGSRLVTSAFVLGVSHRRDETVGAASTICSKLSSTSSKHLLPMWSLTGPSAPMAAPIAPRPGAVAECLERDPEDAVGELLDCFGRELHREPRLAAAARPGQGQQAMRTDEGARFGELTFSADDRRRLDRECRPIQRLERRELLVAQLVEPLRRAEVLSGVSEVAQLHPRAEKSLRRLRDEHLTAVAGAHDPRGTVDVGADVSLFGDDRLPRVHAHAHADGPAASAP